MKNAADCSDAFLGELEKIVLLGDEVPQKGLTDRIQRSETLAYHEVGGKPVTVAALKNPNRTYWSSLSEKSKYKLSRADFPFEIGWVFVTEAFRNKRLSGELVDACLAAANGHGVIATTREDNDVMRWSLFKRGFRRAGLPYLSSRKKQLLVLYVKPSAKKE